MTETPDQKIVTPLMSETETEPFTIALPPFFVNLSKHSAHNDNASWQSFNDYRIDNSNDPVCQDVLQTLKKIDQFCAAAAEECKKKKQEKEEEPSIPMMFELLHQMGFFFLVLHRNRELIVQSGCLSENILFERLGNVDQIANAVTLIASYSNKSRDEIIKRLVSSMDQYISLNTVTNSVTDALMCDVGIYRRHPVNASEPIILIPMYKDEMKMMTFF